MLPPNVELGGLLDVGSDGRATRTLAGADASFPTRLALPMAGREDLIGQSTHPANRAKLPPCR